MVSHAYTFDMPTSTYVARLATVALVAIAYFVAIIVLLHFVRTDRDPISQTTSEYAVGDHGYLMASAFLSMSVACVALLIGLYSRLSSSARPRVGFALLGVWSVGVLIAMIFPIDVDGAAQTTTGTIHRINGQLIFLSLTAAVILISHRFKNDESWRPFHRVAQYLSLIMLAGAIATFLSSVTDAGITGLGQRVVLVVFVTWFVLTALHLRSLERSAEPRRSVSAKHEVAMPEANPPE